MLREDASGTECGGDEEFPETSSCHDNVFSDTNRPVLLDEKVRETSTDRDAPFFANICLFMSGFTNP